MKKYFWVCIIKFDDGGQIIIVYAQNPPLNYHTDTSSGVDGG